MQVDQQDEEGRTALHFAGAYLRTCVCPGAVTGAETLWVRQGGCDRVRVTEGCDRVAGVVYVVALPAHVQCMQSLGHGSSHVFSC